MNNKNLIGLFFYCLGIENVLEKLIQIFTTHEPKFIIDMRNWSFSNIKIVLCYIWIRGRYKITETMNILFDTLLTWLIQPLIMKRNKYKMGIWRVNEEWHVWMAVIDIRAYKNLIVQVVFIPAIIWLSKYYFFWNLTNIE